jgi:uncharacterized protein YdbL (DUF1318 family)
MDDFSDSSLFVPDNFSYEPASLPGGWSLSEGLTSAVKTAGELFAGYLGVTSAINNAKYTLESQKLDLLRASSAIDVSRTVTAANADIAKLQAQAAIERARGQTSAGQSDLSTILGNINARIAGTSSTNQLMLWLTVAGVGFAAMQYFKGRK